MNDREPPRLDRWILLWIAVGCALRLTGLGVHSLWYDEGCSLAVAVADDPTAVLRRDHHPPLWFLLIRGWIGLGGQGDAWLRLLPALLSCASVALFAHWARAIAPSAARVAVALFAVAPFQVWHGQELRAYPLLEVGVLGALIGALHVQRARPLAGAALVAFGQAVAFGAHYMGAMLFAAVCAFALTSLWTRRATLARAATMVAACAAGIAAWSPFLLAHFATQRRAPWGHAAHLGLRELVEVPVRHILVENAAVPQPWLTGLYAVALALLALFLVAAASAARKREPSALLVAAVFMGPLVGVLAAVPLLQSGFQPKYVFVATPATALMMAQGALAIPWARARGALIAFVVAGAACLSLAHKTGNLREDYRTACAEVAAAWRPGDLVVSITGTIEPFSSATVRHYLREREDVVASIASETDIEAVIRRVRETRVRLHVVYREADYAAGPLAAVQRSLARVEVSPNRFRIVRTVWQAAER